MTASELRQELKSMTCPTHGEHPQIKIIKGMPEVWICCCLEFRQQLDSIIEKRKNDVVKPKRPISEARRKALAEERARKQEERLRIKAEEKAIRDSVPIWGKGIEKAKYFIEQTYKIVIADLDKKQIQDLLHDYDEVKNSLPNEYRMQSDYIVNKHPKLCKDFQYVFPRIEIIRKQCEAALRIRKKTVSQRMRENAIEDSPYFYKMVRLYTDKPNKTDLWYENESRRFFLSIHKDPIDYLEAYGRKVRGGLVKTEIVIEGEEDIDRWGYFKLANTFLPFCLREVCVKSGTAEIQFYTFKAVSEMDDYDYDEAITDRIILLNSKGIKTNP